MKNVGREKSKPRIEPVEDKLERLEELLERVTFPAERT